MPYTLEYDYWRLVSVEYRMVDGEFTEIMNWKVGTVDLDESIPGGYDGNIVQGNKVNILTAQQKNQFKNFVKSRVAALKTELDVAKGEEWCES